MEAIISDCRFQKETKFQDFEARHLGSGQINDGLRTKVNGLLIWSGAPEDPVCLAACHISRLIETRPEV